MLRRLYDRLITTLVVVAVILSRNSKELLEMRPVARHLVCGVGLRRFGIP